MATQLWREIAAAFEMKQVFQYHGMGRTGSVRPHLLKGIWYRPRWLLNGGVWSIAADAFLGSGITGRVRALLGRLPLKRLYS